MRPDAYTHGMIPNKTKIKNNSKVYVWGAAINSIFNQLKNSNIENIILFSGDEDNSQNSNGNKTQHIPPPNIIKWHAQNAEVENNFIKPLPIGLCPPWARGICNSEQLEKVVIDIERNKLLYLNFSNNTNHFQRSEIYNIVFNNTKHLNSCTFAEKYFEKPEIYQYYKNIQQHKFILCPPGNGKDTHRTWEALYLGAIPIVEDSVMNRFFAKYFPIVVVDRWYDINEQYLLQKYQDISNKTWRYDLLDCNNWLKEHELK
jgi:hypothetical protein